MSRLSKGRLSGIAEEIGALEVETVSSDDKNTGKESNLLSDRTSTIVKEHEQERLRKLVFKVPHEQVYIPDYHDREYSDLNESNCQDLIDAFQARGKQDTAAIVRRAKNPPNSTVKYELCTGARRHWTSKFLGWGLLIEVRELDDREVFELNDIENRARKDVNDYERGKRYLKALNDKLYPDQGQLQTRLGLSSGQVSKLLSLGKLPQEVVDAYPSKEDIKIRHGADLSPMLQNEKSRKELIARAKKIIEQKLKGETFNGSQVFKSLIEGKPGVKKTKPKPVSEIKNKAGKSVGKLEKKGGHFYLKVSAKPEDSPEDTVKKLTVELKKMMGKA